MPGDTTNPPRERILTAHLSPKSSASPSDCQSTHSFVLVGGPLEIPEKKEETVSRCAGVRLWGVCELKVIPR